MISSDKLGKAKQILLAVKSEKEIVEKLKLDEVELEGLIQYIERIISNWRICD